MELPILNPSTLEPGTRVLVRADLNVPLADGGVGNDRRIRAVLPTIDGLRRAGQRVIVGAHLGRPDGRYNPDLTMAPVAARLGQLLGTRVQLGPGSVVGDVAEEAVSRLGDGEVLLLDNLRFHPGERDCDDDFVEALVRLADSYVNDAFAACHRAHGSIVGPPRHLPSVAGPLVRQEVDEVGGLRDEPQQPFIGLLGGVKVADKLGVVDALLDRCERLLIGGAMSLTFLAARGYDVGNSPVETDALDQCRDLLARGTIELPTDLVVAEAARPGTDHRTVAVDGTPAGWVGVDIGPETSDRFGTILRDAASVFWNGPMGIVEVDEFAAGSRYIAEVLAYSDGHVVVGGGDTGAVVDRFGVSDRIDHVSTGGGAALQLLADGDLPGLRALRESVTLAGAGRGPH